MLPSSFGCFSWVFLFPKYLHLGLVVSSFKSVFSKCSMLLFFPAISLLKCSSVFSAFKFNLKLLHSFLWSIYSYNYQNQLELKVIKQSINNQQDSINYAQVSLDLLLIYQQIVSLEHYCLLVLIQSQCTLLLPLSY